MNTSTEFRIRFAPVHDQASIPNPAAAGDAGIDLQWQPFLPPDEELNRQGAVAVVSYGYVSVLGTGVAVEIPDDHVGLVCPRSGLAHNEGITIVNGPGVIDPGYRGEIKVILTRVNPGHHLVHVRDRIAQLLLIPLTRAVPHLVSHSDLTPTGRGDAGFGSTGR